MNLPRGFDVHIHIDEIEELDALDELLIVHLTYLSADELKRARVIPAQMDRNIFVLSHGRLRIYLARYLGCGFDDIQLSTDVQGKPELASPLSAWDELSFNISHSGRYIGYAFGDGSDVGFDLEQAREIAHPSRLAKDILHGREFDHFRTLPERNRSSYLQTIWTRKEAVLKASGCVRAYPPASFFVGHDKEMSIVKLGRVNYALVSPDVADGLFCAVARKGQEILPIRAFRDNSEGHGSLRI